MQIVLSREKQRQIVDVPRPTVALEVYRDAAAIRRMEVDLYELWSIDHNLRLVYRYRQTVPRAK